MSMRFILFSSASDENGLTFGLRTDVDDFLFLWLSSLGFGLCTTSLLPLRRDDVYLGLVSSTWHDRIGMEIGTRNDHDEAVQHVRRIDTIADDAVAHSLLCP